MEYRAKRQQLFEEKVIKRCRGLKTIFIFISKGDEIKTHNIIRKLLNNHKKVVVPICIISNKTMILSEIKEFRESQFIKSSFGILEPYEHEIVPVNKKDIDIFFVPGTMFDMAGNRKGRGMGFFDRFLTDIKDEKPIIGLCHHWQYQKSIKHEDWDVAVDEVIHD